ncbi:MAG TPA: glycoside hydrolase family 3 C-terminal domain-containing protein, partial [Candidatus Solibacter sp.]|nr:glycoside hydrolase family 3 C-terminal domain-containing protein [Candidatus Solibacter sp.]
MTQRMATRAFVLTLLCTAMGPAQAPDKPPYLNPDLPAERRAADLVSRMTLEEKVLQMQNSAPALPRLNIPAYDWWNEALHGVARAGRATVFPQAIALAATWDTDLMGRIADVISTEARAKYNEAIRNNQHGRYQGLTFWSPNINIFRDPRWGRGQETYGEDPYLTARMAVAFIKGMQGNDPKYYKVIATAKHYAVHSGPESTRHSFDVHPSSTDLADTYLPAFRASILEAQAYSVMCAYNSVNGVPACANTDLLVKTLRGDWQFPGYIVSDCGAIADIYRFHKYKATAAEASAVAVKAGTDLTCGTEYRSLVDAVKNGLITEAEIDTSLKRLFVARFKLGMFDPPERVPWSNIPYSEVDSDAHRALALEAAHKSIVLLKNDGGVLPLKSTVKTIAVVGPSAADAEALLGNYNGFSQKHVAPLEGMQTRFAGKAEIRYAMGAPYVNETGATIPSVFIKDGVLTAPFSGEYRFAARGRRGARVLVEGNPLTGSVGLEAGHAYKLRAEGGTSIRWQPPAEPMLAEAVETMQSADVIVAFIGLNPNLEGEEMNVQVPGFSGGDRTDLKLPDPQERLLEAAYATGKPVVVVLTSGSAVALASAKEHAAAVLAEWYNGEEAGTAIADTIAGVNNPSGRLPVTFYKSVSDLPAFDEYSMAGRTYRYFKGEPLWSFGAGVSYSKFVYGPVRTLGNTIGVQVKNVSITEGDQVVQLYVSRPGADSPIRELIGFRRVHLKPSQSTEVRFPAPALKGKLSVQ